MESLRTANINESRNAEDLHHNLTMLDGKHEITALRQVSYKAVIAKYYDRRTYGKAHKVWDWVLRKNEANRQEPGGKLGHS